MSFENSTFGLAAFKKLNGLAHTSNSAEPNNEGLASTISIAAQDIYGPRTVIPTSSLDAIADNLAVYVNAKLEMLEGNENSYRATIDGYVSSSPLNGKTNPLTGDVYINNDVVGAFIPVSYGESYRAVLKKDGVEISPFDERNWLFDYKAGILFSEEALDLDGYGTLDGYVYVAEYLSSAIERLQWDNNGIHIHNINDGYVGIGISTPSTFLEVSASGTDDSALKISNTVERYASMDFQTGADYFNRFSAGLDLADTGIPVFKILSHYEDLEDGYGLDGPGRFVSIHYNGNVGIGTIATNSALEIYSAAGAGSSNASIDISNARSDSNSYITLANDDNDSLEISVNGTAHAVTPYFGLSTTQSTMNIISWGETGLGSLLIGTYAAQDLILGTTNIERMRLTDDGYVGIGTPSPSQKLTVAGMIYTTTGGVKYPDGTIQTTWADVIGPASSTANAIAKFNGTTGKTIMNSGVVIDASNNMSFPNDAVHTISTAQSVGTVGRMLTIASGSAPTSATASSQSGGALAFQSGVGANASGAFTGGFGGNVTISAGSGGLAATTTIGGAGGDIQITPGAGSIGGTTAAGRYAGSLILFGANGGSASTNAGSSGAGGAGSSVDFVAGTGGSASTGLGAGGIGGYISLVCGDGGAGTATGGSGMGGEVIISAGNAGVVGSVGAAGGNVTITAGQGTGSAADGKISIVSGGAEVVAVTGKGIGRVFNGTNYIGTAALLLPTSTYTLADLTAHWVYLGTLLRDTTFSSIRFYMTTGAGTVVGAQVGLFSTPDAPSNASQTLTKLVAAAATATLTTTGVKDNTFTPTLVVAGTHLWAGVYIDSTGTVPVVTAAGGDRTTAMFLDLTLTTNLFTNTSTWDGNPTTGNVTQAQGPDLVAFYTA